MRQYVYVDVDNIYIIRNKVNPKILLKRVQHIVHRYGHKSNSCMFFGNSFTHNILKEYGIIEATGINFFSSDIEANSADHNLIHRIRGKQATIITGDMTLCRIAKFVHPKKDIKCMTFLDDNKLHPLEVDFAFKRREHLDKFVKSLEMYSVRYA